MVVDLTEFQDALGTHSPLVKLRELSIEHLEKGLGRAEMLEVLRELREQYRADGNGHAEDIVLDTMDFVTGWCSPHMRIP
jgi:hypothetical protein